MSVELSKTTELANEVNEVVQIKVVGVGGGGGNAIDRMVEAGVSGAEFVAVIGSDELEKGVLTVKNMKDGVSEIVSFSVLTSYIKKR